MPRLTAKLLHRRKRPTPEDKDAASGISEARYDLIVESKNPTTSQAQVSAVANSDSQGDIKKTKTLNFWQEAYEEILGDEDEQIKKILAAYDVLLERAARTDGRTTSGNASHLMDTQNRCTDVGFSRDSSSAEVDIAESSSSELSDLDIHQIPSTRRMVVGDDAKMRAVVKIKLEEMQQKEWVLKWHGHVFKVREEVTRVVGIVQELSGFASQTAVLNPYSGLAWAGICVLLPIITNDTDERQIAIDGVSKATELVARYRTVEEDYSDGRHGKHEDFEKVLVAMYRMITLFCIKAACYFARPTLKRTLRGIVVLDDWKSTLASLTKADEEIETSNQIDRIKAWLLSDVDVDKQHLDKQDKLGSEFRNSGRWFLDSSEFKKWEGSTSSHLWISGTVGTGKTSLVSIVVNSLRSLSTENLAFFYYSVDTSKTLQTPNTVSRLEQILRGLVGQLAMSSDRTRVTEEVQIAFGKALKHGTLQPAPLGWEGAKSLLIEIIANRRNSTIIIDGIDEFPEFTNLLKELKAIHDAVKPGQLRLLLASQTVVPVSEYFPFTILMVAGGEKSKPDVDAFIRRRVELFGSEHPRALTQAVADDMVETLSENAEGMTTGSLSSDNTFAACSSGSWPEYLALHPEGSASSGPVSKICQNFLHTSENGIIAASHSSVWDYVSLKMTAKVADFIECAEGDEEQEQRSASILQEAKKTTALLANKRIAQDCLSMIVDSHDSAFLADAQMQTPLLWYACRNWYKHVDAITEDGMVSAELQNQVTAMFDSRCIKHWVSAYDSHVSDCTAAPDPLYYATLLGYTSIVKLLLGSGVGPGTGGHLGQTLQLAAFQGKTAIVRELLGKGFNIDQPDEVLGTPLQAAIAGGRRELVNILLDDYSANVDASGVSFGNALQMALAMQDQELVASLRAHGAGHKETTPRDRIWDNAWRTARGARFNADETINVLRNTFLITPELPDGVDRRLKLLAICIHHRREIIRHQKLADYSEHVWRSKEELRVKIEKEGT
ncbi:ankyrin repeat-containing protein [Fusarium subglutinans]|uniref:Ankyrin repeat-containing protein n=1 Tax=Gibberella subglutinans TaxID=42677 RepID=A0A8H5L433_GIBSU|nr:ankyrin repeat-containing protein [Fusarium subglutinans]KAF5586005.1 ankyrin repeat-containing protein [Fusarium subglutinans]